MGDVIPFDIQNRQYSTAELQVFKEMLEIQLQAARAFSEPLLHDLAWVNSQLASNEARQLNLPFEDNVLEIEIEYEEEE